MSEKEKGGSSGSLTAIIALPILYVLSIGPVGYVVEQVEIQDETAIAVIRGFYYPLIMLHEHTPLSGPIDWYADRWRPDRP